MYEFKVLPFEEQALIVQRQAAYALDREDSNCDYMLYLLSDFYVELEFGAGEEEIMKITCFRSGKILDTYLNQIDISEALMAL